jgi:hypothetical protein
MKPRYLLALPAAGLAAGLALAIAPAASASPAWGSPTPSPSPSTVLYTPPPQHHKHHPREVCFYSLETEHDTLTGQQVGSQGDQGGYYSDPSAAQSYGQAQRNDQGGQKAEEVVVVQLVRVCVEGDQVTATDVTQPFAWEQPVGGWAPTPNGLPSGIGGLLTK